MLANELLSSLHGQVALKAVHRFLTHNPEWVGQVSRGECANVDIDVQHVSNLLMVMGGLVNKDLENLNHIKMYSWVGLA